jgi:ferritin-like metal-binding protein YciE
MDMATSDTPARDAVLVKYLNEAYGKEQQLETALKAQIAIAQRPQLKKGLQDHLKVTKAQSRGLKKRIKELGGQAASGPDLPGPQVTSDLAGAAMSAVNKTMAAAKGPVQALRGTSPADNELRNVRDCLWNEAEEIAHYNVIEATADALGDRETAKLARTYRAEEERMQKLLERQIAPLVKQVIKDEVPAAERRNGASGGTRRRASASSSRARSSRSASSRSTSSSRSSSSSRSTGSRARRCMKNSATSAALIAAIAKFATPFHTPIGT